MARGSRGFPRLLTVRSEVIATFSVVAATGLIFWASGFERTIVKDWAQIAFWITASMVAWLTYLNARRGVLQPLRTEVFKTQLEALKNVQSLFIAKTERELHALVGLDEMVKRNAQKLLADYAKVQFARDGNGGMATGQRGHCMFPGRRNVAETSKPKSLARSRLFLNVSMGHDHRLKRFEHRNV